MRDKHASHNSDLEKLVFVRAECEVGIEPQ